MEIFGIGLFEIVLVLLLATIIFGPQRLPKIAGQMGRSVRELREYARDFRDEYLVDFEEAKEDYLEMRHDLRVSEAEIKEEWKKADAEVQAHRSRGPQRRPAGRRPGGRGGQGARPPRPATAPPAPAAARSGPARPVRRPAEAPVARPSNVIALNRRRRDPS